MDISETYYNLIKDRLDGKIDNNLKKSSNNRVVEKKEDFSTLFDNFG